MLAVFGFGKVDTWIGLVADQLEPRAYSSRQFMDVLGDRLEDPESIVRTCRKYSVPMFAPAINDSSRDLELLFQRARTYDAGWISVGPLFLASGSRRRFLDWLSETMPEKLPVYRRLFARGMDVDPRWALDLKRRVAVLRRRTGLPDRTSREPGALQLVLPGLGRSGVTGGLHSSREDAGGTLP